ncbi:PBS lyase HEAT domain protein repeat-containing protein (plasmid) [Thalassoporum mexicanum PCC 7367]|uniref:HEAT repeat domain-containing protein n=1 Tax=Thalassoporum mexicanum TaxID=3457544 RepID=UPI00029FCD09|nr:HEAT repeat domain-containing protein [Pseudanabaena sp. PCC 7367]AFY72141.1 PBS lyase HEAT domain protein repeat-containing protein [Pseudanabaena sp. PCC 7367]
MTTDTQVSALIQAVVKATSSDSLLTAVEDLAAIGDPVAIPTLIEVLGFNNPGAAVAAVDGLIRIGPLCVDALLEQLDAHNYGARAWAVRALAGIGDPRALDILLESAVEDIALSVRRAAARGLGKINWHLLPIEAIAPAQSQTLVALLKVTTDSEWIVRYAAIVGLQGLLMAMDGAQEASRSQICECVVAIGKEDESLAVRARAWFVQQQLPQLFGNSAAGHQQDWQSALELLYQRKSSEKPLPEGDPRRFLNLVG